jgi:hypothetical protein
VPLSESTARILISTSLDRSGEAVAHQLELRANEGVLLEVA